jgi:hypothetical protein
MSEQPTPNMIQVESIPMDAIVNIKVSGAYYATLQQVFMDLAMTRPEAEFKTAMEKLKGNEKPSSKYEMHLQTLLALIFEVENEAKAQGLVVKKEVDMSKIKPIDG